MSPPRAAAQRHARRAARREALLANAHDSATDRLWEQISLACQHHNDPHRRIALAVAAALRLLDSEPSTARLLLLDAPTRAEHCIAKRHLLLLDHLEALLRATRGRRAAGVRDGRPGPEAQPERRALECAFALTAKRLRERDPAPLAELAPQLTDLLLAPAAGELPGGSLSRC